MPEEPVKTFEGEVSRLAEKYAQKEEVAKKIIWCESRNNPRAINEKAVVGVDVGYWQINTHFWEAEMLRRGWNIHDEWDNLEAGFWLIKEQGTRPWNWSKHCWGSL